MITDMIAMTDVKMICLSSTERKLSFYDIAANKFELRMQVCTKIFIIINQQILLMNIYQTINCDIILNCFQFHADI